MSFLDRAQRTCAQLLVIAIAFTCLAVPAGAVDLPVLKPFGLELGKPVPAAYMPGSAPEVETDDGVTLHVYEDLTKVPTPNQLISSYEFTIEPKSGLLVKVEARSKYLNRATYCMSVW